MIRRLATSAQVLLLAFSPLVVAEELLNVRFKHLTREDGLSQAYVYAIQQDSRGYLWLGTQDGLNRYDGYGFEVFVNVADDPTTLARNTVRTILEDSAGRLWVGTDSGGLSRFDRRTQSFVHFRHDPDDPESLSDDRVRVVYEDSSGFVWVGTDGAGLNRFDPSAERFVPFPLDAGNSADLSGGNVWAIVEDTEGALWVGTDGGLYRLDIDSGHVSRFAPDRANPGALQDRFARRLLIDSDGALWVGTENAGLARFDPTTNAFVHIRHDPNDAASLTSDRVTALLEDDTGTLWVGTADGLNAIERGTDRIRRFQNDPSDPTSLGNDVVISLAQDQGGLLWVGTYDGLSYWDTRTAPMAHYRSIPGQSGLTENQVFDLFEDARGDIWVATFGGGLNILDPATDTFRQLTRADGLSSNRITVVAADANGALWAGSRSRGVNRIDPESGRIDVHRAADSDNGLRVDGVSAALLDSSGRLWIGTFGGGLHYVDEGSETVLRWSSDVYPELDTDRIVSLYEDSLGYLWIGTYGSGIRMLDLSGGELTTIGPSALDGKGLSGENILAMVEDRLGNLWIAAQGRGLNRWRLDARRAGVVSIDYFDVSDGLPHATVHGAVSDPFGKLWFSTGSGLAQLDPRTLDVVAFDTDDGLQDLEFNTGAALAASNGRLYFGGVNGFNAFMAGEVVRNLHPPQLGIRGFSRQNQPVNIVPYLLDDEPFELTHRDYFIEIDMVALDYAAPSKNRYRYRLDGLDTDWVEAGTRRTATYTNLAAGDYLFRFQGANDDGIWSEDEATLALTVHPAPWLSPLAYTGYTLSALLLAAWVVVAHGRRLEQRSRLQHAAELEAINVRLTDEVAERKLKETQLESEKRRAQTYFNVAEVVLVTLRRDGTIGRINRKGALLLERDVNALVGSDWFECVAEDYRKVVADELLHRADRDGPKFQDYLEYPIVSAGGRQYLVAWHCTLLEEDDGERVVFCSGMDVTRVRSLEKRMRLREKMNAIGELAGGIAHDFNNILQAIYGFTTLALDRLDPGDERAVYLKQVVNGAERARTLVRRILTFSNQKEYDLKTIDLAPVVEEACALLRGSLPSTVEIRTRIDTDGALILGDPTRIHQMLMNLGTNAGQAIGDKPGVFDVQVSEVELSQEHITEGSRLSPGRHIMLRASDNGPGIDRETLDHIFDPFFTTKDSDGSTGLGLTVVHGIVQSHNGYIEVDSRLGRGTTFIVYLPVAEGDGMEMASESTGPKPGNERILLVDDEPWVATVTTKILEGQGYKVVSAPSGQAAIDAMRSASDAFNIVITDETMPKMTGSELVARIRVDHANIPIVIISGKQAPKAVGYERTRFVQKPFTADEICDAVRSLLDT